MKPGRIGRAVVFIILVILAASTLLPIIYMVLTTFVTNQRYSLNMFSLPVSLYLENYKTVLISFNFLKMTLNSLLISGSSVLLSLFITSMAGYSLSKLEWKGKKIVMLLIIAGMFMPGQVLILPVYQILIRLNMINTYWGLIIFYISTSIPFTTIMIMAAIKGIPNEIIESASIDGAGSFTVYRSLILPLLKPTLATATILNFIGYWNELLYALIILQDEDKRTVTVSIVSLTNKFVSSPPMLYAGLLLSALPVIIIYFVAQKHIISGVSAGAVK